VRAPRLYPDPGSWFAPPGSNQSGDRGNEVVGASGVEGRLGDLAGKTNARQTMTDWVAGVLRILQKTRRVGRSQIVVSCA